MTVARSGKWRGRPVSVDEGPYPNRVRAVRREKQMTQATLGRRVGLAQSQIGRIERGQQRIPPDKLQVFADALDVPAWRLAYYPDLHRASITAIDLFGQLTHDNQQTVLDVMRSLLEHQPVPKPPASSHAQRRRK